MSESLIDYERSVCLCDVGAPDYAAAVTVDSDGNDHFWLICKEVLNERDADIGNPNPRHEKLGRLPQPIRDRIWGDELRCGRPTLAGKPCKQRVAEPGRSCTVHCDGSSCGNCRSCYLNNRGEVSR